MLPNERESIDVDDLFKAEARRLQNENGERILVAKDALFRTTTIMRKLRGCSIRSALTKETVSVKEGRGGKEGQSARTHTGSTVLKEWLSPKRERKFTHYLHAGLY